MDSELETARKTKIQRMLGRNFDLDSERIIAFRMGGGLGDLLISMECALALRQFLNSKGNRKSKLVGCFPKFWSKFFDRFFEQVLIFDHCVYTDDVQLNRLENIEWLECSPGGQGPEPTVSIGSIWEVYWASWGVPGRFVPPEMELILRKCKEATKLESGKIQSWLGLAPNERYIYIAPQANSLGQKKTMPDSSWLRLIEQLIQNTEYSVIVGSNEKKWADLLSYYSRVKLYEFGVRKISQEIEFINDFQLLSSLILNSMAVISVDSGVAQVAGFLRHNCLTLWGPTSPLIYGHSNNLNLRVSFCPPCSWDSRQNLCIENECMRAFMPEEIVNKLVGSFSL